MPAPKKEIQVPTGGPPVLTSDERAEQKSNVPAVRTMPADGIAHVSFEQPLEEPQRLKPLNEWSEQEAAADALGRIGAAAVPALVKVLDDPDPAIREKAVGVLGRMGAEAAPAVPKLTLLLNDPHPAVRRATARTLGQIGPAAKEAVPELMRALLEPASPNAID